MSFILAIETSSPRGSIALLDGDSFKCATYREWTRGKSHSELVTSTLQIVLNEASATLNELSGLAVGIGPGSFTGIRVGVNVARTLGYCFHLPVYSVNSLRLLAEPALAGGKPVVSLLNAYRNMVYISGYRRSLSGQVDAFIAPQALRPDQVVALVPSDSILLGDGWTAYQDHWPQTIRSSIETSTSVYPSAKDFSELLRRGDPDISQLPWNELKALYIRASEAEEKLRGGALRPPPKF